MTQLTARRRRTWLIVFAGLVVFFAWFAANAGRILIVDEPVRSDVILVLAGETEMRPARAFESLAQGYGQRVLIDVPSTTTVYGFSEMELARKSFEKLPNAAAVQICPIIGLSTKDESHDAAKCLKAEERTVLIVTSDFHTRRSLSIFRHELHDKSFSVTAAHEPEQFGVHWWKQRQWAKTLVDEWLRLIWWNCVDRWR